MIDSLEIICVNNQVDSDIDDEPYFFSDEEISGKYKVTKKGTFNPQPGMIVTLKLSAHLASIGKFNRRTI